MSIANSRLFRHWSANAIFKGLILVFIVAIATRLVSRSYQKQHSCLLRAELEASIISGDLEKVNRLLGQKLDLNSTDAHGRNIWDHIAFPPRTTDGRKIRPESKEILPKILQLLLDHGADPNSLCGNGTPLIAATYDQPKVIRLLLARGAKADARGEYGGNALSNFADDAETMRLLIDAGADIHARGHSNSTPLMSAARGGTIQTIQLLLDKGAHLEDKDSNGATPLLLAAQSGSQKNVTLLMERGADIHAVDKQSRTALNYAVDNRDIAIGEMFLKKGIRYHPEPEKDCILLGTWDKRTLSFLLRCGININLRENQGQDGMEPTGNTALLRAAVRLNQPFLNQISHNIGAAPERRTQLTKRFAAVVGNAARSTEAAEILLENGADPNLSNFQGWTPLLAATASNNVPLVKVLLAHGANIRQTLPDGITPLQIAQAYGYTKVERLLRDKGA